MVSIAIVDDNLIYLEKIQFQIQKLGKYNICFAAKDGLDFMLSLQRQKILPDIVLLDINIPLIDGITLTCYLKTTYPEIKIVSISNFFEKDILERFYSSGGDGFIFRGMVESILDECFNSVLNGETYFNKLYGGTEEELMNWKLKIQKAYDSRIKYGLSKRELALVILNTSALTYEQISQILFVETKTVYVYFDRISKKLNTTSRQALTIFSLQHGLSQIAIF